jgi:hypothetical protein
MTRLCHADTESTQRLAGGQNHSYRSHWLLLITSSQGRQGCETRTEITGILTTLTKLIPFLLTIKPSNNLLNKKNLG